MQLNLLLLQFLPIYAPVYDVLAVFEKVLFKTFYN